MSKMVGEVITGFRSIIGILVLDTAADGVEVKIIPDWDTLIVEVAKESNSLEAKDIIAGEDIDVTAAIDVEGNADDNADVVTVEAAVKASN